MTAKTSLALLLLSFSFGAFAGPEPDLLIHLERRHVDDLARLRHAGLPVVHETLQSLFLEGDATHLAWLGEHGYEATVLDRYPRDWDYLQVGLRPDSNLDAIRAAGLELFAEENWKLIRVPRGASIDGLVAGRVFVSRLPHRPVDAPVPLPPAGAEAGKAGDGTPDPLIQQMVAAVRPEDVNQYWHDIVDNPPTGTRFTIREGCRDATVYVHDALEALRVPAEYQNYHSMFAPNVIGTHEGALTPEQVYIVIGHLDDMPMQGLAPGADDNASGSVTVLESARVMSCYAFRSTIKFIACTGEELGLWGSDAYAADAKARGEDIRGVLNFDMNGWEGNGSPDPEDLDLNFNAASEDLGLLFAQCAADYDTGLVVDAFLCPSLTASDHYSFWKRGYKAVCGITDNEGYCDHVGHYPYYHTSNDTIANCGDPTFFHGTIRATVATLATLAKPFKITFADPSAVCNEPALLLVGDRDLNTDPVATETVAVEVWSTTEPSPETILLTEEGTDAMIFTGQAETTTNAPVPGDGVVSVSPGDTITARYVDALDCNGATQVTFTTEAAVECSGFAPGEVTGLAVDDSSATRVTWTAQAETSAYDVAGGSVLERRADGDWDRTDCLGDEVTATSWDDTRQDPTPNDGYYYLVRGVNAFGTGTYGWQSNGQERTIDACP